jgi:hypothetical protein
MSTFRNLALSLAAGVIAFFIVAIPTDSRPFCGSIPPEGHASTCNGGPIPVDWYLNALPIGIAVFLVVLVGLWAVERRRHPRDGNA